MYTHIHIKRNETPKDRIGDRPKRKKRKLQR
jgi:hypothetical protein